MDCRSVEPEWADVSHGILVCIQCAGRHRALGVQTSFVRSLTMDNWTDENVLAMRLGGNDQLRGFFTRQKIVNSAIEVLYTTKQATYYREQLRQQIEKMLSDRRPSSSKNKKSSSSSSSSTARRSRHAADIDSPPRKERTRSTNDGGGGGGGAGGHDGGHDGGSSSRTSSSSRRPSEGERHERHEQGGGRGGSRHHRHHGQHRPSRHGGSHARPAAPPPKPLVVAEFELTFRYSTMGLSITRAMPPPGVPAMMMNGSGHGNGSAALVTRLTPDGVAALSGVRIGDFVCEINGRRVADYDEVRGRRLDVTIHRADGIIERHRARTGCLVVWDAVRGPLASSRQEGSCRSPPPCLVLALTTRTVPTVPTVPTRRRQLMSFISTAGRPLALKFRRYAASPSPVDEAMEAHELARLRAVEAEREAEREAREAREARRAIEEIEAIEREARQQSSSHASLRRSRSGTCAAHAHPKPHHPAPSPMSDVWSRRPVVSVAPRAPPRWSRAPPPWSSL